MSELDKIFKTLMNVFSHKQLGLYVNISKAAKTRKALGVHSIWGLKKKSYENQDPFDLSDTDSDNE